MSQDAEFALAALVGGLCAHWFIGRQVVPFGMVAGCFFWGILRRVTA